MQKEVISLSDFFGQWAKLKMQLTKFSSDDLAKNLLSEMNQREKHLFNNPVLNAAVFLDPRYQKYMPIENKDDAIDFLERLHDKLRSLERDSNNGAISLNPESNELEAFLSTIYDNSNATTSNSVVNTEERNVTDDIHTRLKGFIGISAPMNETIYGYWENNKHAHPELYELASIIHSVPPTQTTVERAFSAMALVLSPLRTNLSDKNLENILIVRLNRDIFESTSEF